MMLELLFDGCYVLFVVGSVDTVLFFIFDCLTSDLLLAGNNTGSEGVEHTLTVLGIVGDRVGFVILFVGGVNFMTGFLLVCFGLVRHSLLLRSFFEVGICARSAGRPPHE